MGGVISLSDMNSELLGAQRWWRYIKNEIDGCWKEGGAQRGGGIERGVGVVVPSAGS